MIKVTAECNNFFRSEVNNLLVTIVAYENHTKECCENESKSEQQLVGINLDLFDYYSNDELTIHKACFIICSFIH